ncbi:hypothetical protein RJ639_039713 [Escallonia herrerae]|uniref:Uncharacterized protein n=1 Tax=Escallonia herrerae TaxID=1293975 RepID=A0AA89B7E0_9ASTE|nr:hypothetical protein RJ639_039713 [Escallonia herrerae]
MERLKSRGKSFNWFSHAVPLDINFETTDHRPGLFFKTGTDKNSKRDWKIEMLTALTSLSTLITAPRVLGWDLEGKLIDRMWCLLLVFEEVAIDVLAFIRGLKFLMCYSIRQADVGSAISELENFNIRCTSIEFISDCNPKKGDRLQGFRQYRWIQKFYQILQIAKLNEFISDCKAKREFFHPCDVSPSLEDHVILSALKGYGLLLDPLFEKLYDGVQIA